MPHPDDRRPNQPTQQIARKTGPLGGRPRVGPGGIAAGLTGGRAPLSPAQNQTLDIFRHATGPGGLPGLTGGPAPLPGSAVAPETVQGLQGAAVGGGLTRPPAAAPPTTEDRATNAGLAALPSAPGANVVPQVDAAVAAAQQETERQQGVLAGGNLQDVRQLRSDLLTARGGRASGFDRGPGRDEANAQVDALIAAADTGPRLSPSGVLRGNQNPMFPSANAHQPGLPVGIGDGTGPIGDREQFEAQRAANTLPRIPFKAGVPRSSFKGGLGEFTSAQKQLREDQRAGLSGDDLFERDLAIGAFNPTGASPEEAAASQRSRLFSLREDRAVGGPGVVGGELDQGQLDRRQGRERELARRKLRRTNRGVGAPFNISDEEADVQLQRQAIRQGLAGGGQITEEQSQFLGRQPGATIQGQELQQLGQATPEGAAAIERGRQRRGLTGRGGGVLNPGDPGSVAFFQGEVAGQVAAAQQGEFATAVAEGDTRAVRDILVANGVPEDDINSLLRSMKPLENDPIGFFARPTTEPVTPSVRNPSGRRTKRAPTGQEFIAPLGNTIREPNTLGPLNSPRRR